MCTGDGTSAATDSPLWIARYTTEDSPGELPAGWESYSFWQYHSGSGGFPGNEDVFNGTRSELVELAMRGPIVAHYEEVGGPNSFLGEPVGELTSIADGRMQRYEGGRIYWSPGNGAHVVRGPILERYLELDGPEGVLGFPTTDQRITPDGVGRYNHFVGNGGGSVYWTPDTGAHAISGAIRAKWASLGWERGPLGYPTTDKRVTPDGVGRYNHFSKRGSVYWTPDTGAHAISGAIRAKWASLGWERGPLGYPTTDKRVTPDGVGRYNHFSRRGGASIYWTADTGAHATYGAIRAKWASLGWECGRLGYPTSDEYGIPGGRANNYQHGKISWDRDTHATRVTYY